MIIKKDKDVSIVDVNMEGVKGVKKKILIGRDDNSEDIIMRKFTIKEGGHTPYHVHDHPHIVKWISGEGIIVDESGKEHHMKEGMSGFINGGEKHQFKNLSNSGKCSFLCIIPNTEK